MPTLFEIGGEITALHDLLTETGGELPDAEAEAAIDEWLRETEQALEKKVNSICWLLREFEGRSEIREQAAKALAASAKHDKNQAERLKARLKAFLEICGLEKLQTEHFKLSIQANGSVLPLIVPPEWGRDPAEAPEAFQKRVIQLDTAAIREAIRNDEETHGASLGERGTQLRIR
ncbi:MAG TPA: siphovirus Gp157 family protein [Blastocatellia bacterium]